MTTIDPYSIDLDAGQEMPPIEPLHKGWHKFYLIDYEFVLNEGKRPYVRLDLQHYDSGVNRACFLNWVMPEDYERPMVKKSSGEQMYDKEGNPMTLAGSMITGIKAVISALGGPESGSISIDTFAQLIGHCALFNVSVEEWPPQSREFRDRIDLAFGKGIKPC